MLLSSAKMRKKEQLFQLARERAVMAWPRGSKTIYQTSSPKGSWFYCAAGVEEERKVSFAHRRTQSNLMKLLSPTRASFLWRARILWFIRQRVQAPVLHYLRGCRCQWKSWPGASKVSFVRVSPAVHLATHAGLISNHISSGCAPPSSRIESSLFLLGAPWEFSNRLLSRGRYWKYLQPFLTIGWSGTIARQERFEKSENKTYSQ